MGAGLDFAIDKVEIRKCHRLTDWACAREELDKYLVCIIGQILSGQNWKKYLVGIIGQILGGQNWT